MKFFPIVLLLSLVAGCASFDKTNIRPEQRVPGPAMSFEVPGTKSWFTVDYGRGNHIKLSQLNYDDSFSIDISVNRGPRFGLYQSAEQHLAALKGHVRQKRPPQGFNLKRQDEWIDTRYGDICVRYSSLGEDWRGRNNAGPAMVEIIGLTCAHLSFDNVLIKVELSRRYDEEAEVLDLSTYADALFSSVEYEEM